ncbi:ribose-phosphate diphosphokinase [Pandoraea communis]|uniref:ribose-phosphate diphosphokinase n=1 Tax=Pandoraea communis TaxID=2508297 RepID=A0A5E4UW96_9BURK|nr:ribose-phosphate diphosphokinase [Pandoraea communis]MDM8358025.1 ribose-phosphate diphosphokinase [Pandoraea communis]VVE03369.1 phosphoribosylpyrophosphate synthetase [Pandoraea communis]
MNDVAVYPLPGNELLARSLADAIDSPLQRLSVHHFPDGEQLVSLEGPLSAKSVVLVCSLHRPDAKILPLVFAADTARDLGASNVILVAPYLCYLRQDARFHPGESVSAYCFGRLLSAHIDGLVTMEPHLHRLPSLSAVYSVPVRSPHGVAATAEWISANVRDPLIVGPDDESKAWVTQIAERIGVPCVVAHKTREADRRVSVKLHVPPAYAKRTAVVVDDILSSGQTMLGTIGALVHHGFGNPVCIAVHGLFEGVSVDDLISAGASRVLTCNTVPHASNAIDVTPALADAVRDLLESLPAPL